jgi:hypothetical protein
MVRRAKLALVTVLSCPSWWATPGLAGSEDYFRLDYRAPGECPSASDFLRRLLPKTRRTLPATGAVLARTVHVTLELRGKQAHAKLAFLDRDSKPVERELWAPDCASAVDALVLITALALDSQLARDVAAPELDLGPPYALSPWTTRSGRPAELAAAEFQAQHVNRGEFVLSLGARGHTAAVPEIGRGVALTAGFEQPETGRSLRFGAAWVTAGLVQRESRQARFDGLWAEVSGCAGKTSRKSTSLVPCARVEVGGVRGSGQLTAGVAGVESSTRLWMALDLLLRLEAELWAPLALEFEAGPSLPLTRPRYVFLTPEVEVFQTPSVGLAAGIGIRYRLP